MLLIEHLVRQIDYMKWVYIPSKQPDELGFSSSYDTTFSEKKRVKYQGRKDNAPYTLIQACLCLFGALVNGAFWLAQTKFSPVKHTVHYIVASLLLVLSIPFPEYESLSGPKFAFYNVSVFLFQIVLAMSVGQTGLHTVVTGACTLMYQIAQVKSWYKIRYSSICVWDSYFHVILPGFLILSIGYFQIVDQLKKE